MMPSSTPLLTTVYRDPEGFDVLRPEWNELLAHSAFHSLFLTWEWQTTWWQCLGKGQLCLLAFRTANGELAGIAPLFVTGEAPGCELHLVGCTEVSDYLDLIIAQGREPEVYAAFVRFLAGSEAPAWDRATLCNLYEPSHSYTMLPGLAQAMDWQAEVAQEDVAPYLELPSSFDAYLDSLDKKQRHELRRKRSKLEREAGAWRWFQIEGGDDLETWVDRFLALHRRASAGKDSFMTPRMAAFFQRIARVASAQGWLRLAFIEIDGVLASTYFNFDFDGRIWVYNSGFDPDAYGSLSPGIVLSTLLIEDAIRTGHRLCDFLQGNEIYKYRLGAVEARVMRVTLQR